MAHTIINLNNVDMSDVEKVGGKNASLGEMIKHLSTLGVDVPGGFATTAEAFRDFLHHAQIEQKINTLLTELDINDVNELAKAGRQIRQWVLDADLPRQLRQDIIAAYQAMSVNGMDAKVAIRSSATAEDLPDASFAGQQETYLNIQGIEQVILSVKMVFASLYNDRAISYRVHQGFKHSDVALSAGIQMMVRSDLAASGVMFSIDTESGFDQVVFITSSYGLGETIVQGAVNPDEFYVYKKTFNNQHPVLQKTLGSKKIKMIYANDPDPQKAIQTVPVDHSDQLQFSLNDNDIQQLAKMACIIEAHYQRPMDIEWAKDGLDGRLYIVQARPETVQSRTSKQSIERYQLTQKHTALIEGRAVGNKIGQGVGKVIKDISQMDLIEKGDVLITDMTDPDWEPIMKKASAIVTNRGGRTCHAAIIAREMGIPALVGCGDATDVLNSGKTYTVSCAEGDTGYAYAGLCAFEHTLHEFNNMPDIPVKIMMNIGNPERAFSFAQLPNAGIGLARLEFIINKMIGIHPKALLNFADLDDDLQHTIKQRISAYKSPVDYYINRLAEGISTLAAAFNPKRVIVRMSDFKSNEYAHLTGGAQFEPDEENPMIGYRGTSRYINPDFRDCFELECKAMLKVRNEMGFRNVAVMIPFVRTLEEAATVIDILKSFGLERGKDGLEIIMMCEIPSNVLLADEFLQYFDGFSIGSNDLTQLTLGLDRDSGLIAHSFDERNPAVLKLISSAIKACKAHNKYIGICGQGPSDHPDLAKWLLQQGIDSVSLNPDTVIETWLFMADQVESSQ